MTDSLCKLTDLEDGASAALTATIDGQATALIAVRQGLQVYLYINSCPHIGAPLDFSPGQFLNLERDMIQCAMHGALFRITDGQCVQGPCLGQSLTPVTSEVRDGEVRLV